MDNEFKILPFALSHSAVEKFETCPRSYQASYVTKEVGYTETAARNLGKWLHSAIEDLVATGEYPKTIPEPAFKAHFDKAFNVLNNIKRLNPLHIYTEYATGISADGKACGYFHKQALFRGKSDIVADFGTSLLMADWKTGKERDSDQQRRNVPCLFVAFPKVQSITTLYVFTHTGTVIQDTYQREEFDLIFRELKSTLRPIADAYRKDYWITKSSGLCRAHCAIKACPHNGDYQL